MPASGPRARTRAHHLLVAVVASATLVTGCFTGQRPSFSDDATAPGMITDDDAIDAILERLDRGGQARFKADYDILTRYGSIESEAAVVQATPQRRRLVIGEVEFSAIDGAVSTCRTNPTRCVEELDDSFVSDLQVTHRFYADAAAAKLRHDATNRVRDSEASTDDFAGRTATCVTVYVTGGDKRYCALDSGVLALQDGPDVRIELTEYSEDVRRRDLRGD